MTTTMRLVTLRLPVHRDVGDRQVHDAVSRAVRGGLGIALRSEGLGGSSYGEPEIVVETLAAASGLSSRLTAVHPDLADFAMALKAFDRAMSRGVTADEASLMVAGLVALLTFEAERPDSHDDAKACAERLLDEIGRYNRRSMPPQPPR